jgi:hypothetical protein
LKTSIDAVAQNHSNAYDHCLDMYPKIFFEILYENDSLFEKECFLLPGIDFSLIMKEHEVIGISEKTKKTIWKYLQLILFSVLEKINSKKSFGETSKIFEGVEENELHKKIAETMEEMKNLFVDVSGQDTSGTFDPSGMDPEKMKSHLDDLMNGKIGTLAKEIAEEAKKRLKTLRKPFLTAPLIREVINAILIEKNLSDYRHKLTRLGIPPYDIKCMLGLHRIVYTEKTEVC